MADDLSTGSPDGGAPAPDGPAPITLTDDARFIPPGGKDPVSWKDYSSGFVPKADLTRMRQQDAAQLKTERENIQREQAQLKRSAEQLAQQLRQGHQPQGRQADPFAELESAPYVDGRTAANLARQIVQQGIAPLAQSLHQRDQAIQLLTQRLESLQQSVGSITTQHREGQYSALIDRTISGLGYAGDDWAKEIAQDVYGSHDGCDGDPEGFAAVVKSRIDSGLSRARAADKKRADEARQSQFRKPNQPARPGKPATGFESAESLAARVWPGMQPTQT